MKWLAFTVAVVAGFVGLGIWSVMPPGVVWEDTTAYCPRCRAEVRYYSRQCANCDRSLRWTSTEVECPWCLSKEDAEYLRDSYMALKVEEGMHVGLLQKFPRAYFEAIEAGDCANCAGLGKVKRDDAEVVCPVCRGGQDCIACDGDRDIVVGDEGVHAAWMARIRTHRRAQERSDLTRLPIRRSRLIDEDVEAVRGAAEAQEIRNERGERLVEIARSRAGLAFEALQQAHQQAVKPGAD